FDGGDCCECTCVSTVDNTCGENGGFSCLDPNALCVDDDDVTTLPSSERFCISEYVGDGDCDQNNNFGACGYDGGDCCECTCVSTDQFTCGDADNGGFACIDPTAPCLDNNDDDVKIDDDDVNGLFSICGENAEYDCIDPNASCVNGYVEAGTKTNVFVSTNAYDTRPGQKGGCMVDGCAPALTRDGIIADVQSRWSCNPSIVPDGGLCEIEFVFEEPQDVMSVQVAFWQGEERTRTLEATIDGVVIGEFDSFPGSVFNAFEIKGTDVHTVKLTSTGITRNEWISLIEVRLS
ncbi:unnamed protein product, partial [Laminaria digitata]